MTVPSSIAMALIAVAILGATMSMAFAVPVSVRGAVDCARWRQDRAMESFGARLSEMWLLGYLSGLGVARQADALKGLDSPALFATIDDWCRHNPGDSVDEAADALFDRRTRERAR